MSWIAVGAAVASALVSNYNKNKTARKQDEAALEGLRRQREFEDVSKQRFNQQVQELAQSTPDDERNKLASDIRNQLRAKRAMALSGIQATGGGDDVTMYAGDAGKTATGYGDFIGNTMAALDAPIYQRQKEAYDRADVGNVINTQRRNSSTEDYLTRMRIAGIRPNPWLDLLSSGLSAYATSGLSSGTMFGGGGSGAGPQANLGGMTPQTYYSAMPANNMFIYGGQKTPYVGSMFGGF